MAEPSGATTVAADGAGRKRLVGLAYRLLGSVEEAEDVVQDAYLKVLAIPRRADDPDAYLFRTVTNLAIDRLRHLKVQRRAYPGPWLPEPLATADADGATDLMRADDLSLGFLLLLERLSVTERVALVLREAFDLDFAEMAEVLGVRADACRQRYHRARRKLDGARPAHSTPARQRVLLERLTEALLAGDREAVTRLLSRDAVLLTDGGGRVSAAIRPVVDPRRIAQVMVHIAGREDPASLSLDWRAINAGVALVVGQRDVVHSCVLIEPDGASRIARIYVVRNPDKLARLGRAGS